MREWLANQGELVAVGVEGTGSWGQGLSRYLLANQVTVLEVNRPDRQMRHRRGKSDPTDAEAAARAVLSGTATARPKSADGHVEAIRILRVARRSAMKARIQAGNQLRALIDTAPDHLRSELRDLPLERISQQLRHLSSGSDSLDQAAVRSVTIPARRWENLQEEIQQLDHELDGLTTAAAPELLELPGVGTDTAGAIPVAVGDNPDRLEDEASFAALCGVSPVLASSGRVQPHRLNRGGDREANHALWRIILVRMRWHAPTRAYVQRRTTEGKSTKEIMRSLKRYLARAIYRLLRPHQLLPARQPRGISPFPVGDSGRRRRY